MKKTLKTAFIALIALSTAISCSTDEPDPAPPIEYETAELSSRNYITSDLILDFLMDTVKVNSGLSYAFGGKGSFEWAVGDANVQFSIQNASDNSGLFSANINVEKDKSYYSATAGPATAGVVVWAENDKTLPAEGNVRFRLLNAYQDVGAIDLYIGGTTVDHKVITDLNFGVLSAYIEVSHTDISTMIICTNTGVAPDPNTNLLTTLANTAHEANKIYLDAMASETTDATSKFTLFVTEQ